MHGSVNISIGGAIVNDHAAGTPRNGGRARNAVDFSALDPDVVEGRVDGVGRHGAYLLDDVGRHRLRDGCLLYTSYHCTKNPPDLQDFF